MTVVFEVPALVEQAGKRLLEMRWVITRLENGQRQVRRVDACPHALGEAVQKDGGCRTPAVRWLPRGDEVAVYLGCMRSRTSERANDVRLNDLLEDRAIETARKVVRDISVGEIKMMWMDQVGVGRPILPELTHGGG